MRPAPAVSVILSTRNRAGYLPEVLGSLAAQTGDVPFEVVVVDNGSSDATPALLEDWCRRDPRFRATTEPRPGLSRGKNAGIRAATAPLLLFCDDDMRVAPSWIQAYHDFFARHRDGRLLAGGPVVPIPDDLGRWPDWFDEAALADAGLLHHHEERALRRFEYVWGGNMAVPRLLFDGLGGWEEAAGLQGEARVTNQDSAFFEDTEFQDRARAAGAEVWFCPAAPVRHRVARGGITPRRIAAMAFTRGRNDLWARELPRWGEVRLVPKTSALGCLLELTGSLASWSLWAGVFRLSGWKAPFERARRAAFAAGRALDSLRAGRGSMALFRAAARFAFPVRGLLLRVLPDVP
jgi:glycosyltransferase involved in cell wall biosynthesis